MRWKNKKQKVSTLKIRQIYYWTFLDDKFTLLHIYYSYNIIYWIYVFQIELIYIYPIQSACFNHLKRFKWIRHKPTTTNKRPHARPFPVSLRRKLFVWSLNNILVACRSFYIVSSLALETRTRVLTKLNKDEKTWIISY